MGDFEDRIQLAGEVFSVTTPPPMNPWEHSAIWFRTLAERQQFQEIANSLGLAIHPLEEMIDLGRSGWAVSLPAPVKDDAQASIIFSSEESRNSFLVRLGEIHHDLTRPAATWEDIPGDRAQLHAHDWISEIRIPSSPAGQPAAIWFHDPDERDAYLTNADTFYHEHHPEGIRDLVQRRSRTEESKPADATEDAKWIYRATGRYLDINLGEFSIVVSLLVSQEKATLGLAAWVAPAIALDMLLATIQSEHAKLQSPPSFRDVKAFPTKIELGARDYNTALPDPGFEGPAAIVFPSEEWRQHFLSAIRRHQEAYLESDKPDESYQHPLDVSAKAREDCARILGDVTDRTKPLPLSSGNMTGYAQAKALHSISISLDRIANTLAAQAREDTNVR